MHLAPCLHCHMTAWAIINARHKCASRESCKNKISAPSPAYMWHQWYIIFFYSTSLIMFIQSFFYAHSVLPFLLIVPFVTKDSILIFDLQLLRTHWNECQKQIRRWQLKTQITFVSLPLTGKVVLIGGMTVTLGAVVVTTEREKNHSSQVGTKKQLRKDRERESLKSINNYSSYAEDSGAKCPELVFSFFLSALKVICHFI